MKINRNPPKSFTRWQRFLWGCIQLLAALQEKLHDWIGVQVWRSHDGRVRKISELSDTHLQNCVALCRRQAQDTKLPALLAELNRRNLREL